MTLAPQPSYQQACGFQGDAIPPSPLVAKIARLASHMSFEISPHDIAELEMARDAIPPESSIAITWCPEDSDDQRVDVVNRIRRAGFVPLPHVAARALQDERALSMLLDRCHAADVREILLRDGKFEPEGEFETVLELLVRLRSDRFGLTGIGLWAYAGGRESMATELLDARLDAKLAVAQEAGLSPYVVTQCEFDAAPVLAWIERFRARGTRFPSA
ncbi:hypothetical protein [Novosphingobium sp. 9]|uniref:hypothetical protein n=1 Tax=Novosphingobium sp. 9 TaxID=2025349 RepID=UPI0021B5B828|nr:hypothetical protein [Novosphingobium sp. 9]